MKHSDDDDDDVFLSAGEDDESENGDLDSEAEVACPYCGEVVTISLDPGSGDDQEYVEDCEICCRPWNVHVHYDENGSATVTLEAG